MELAENSFKIKQDNKKVKDVKEVKKSTKAMKAMKATENKEPTEDKEAKDTKEKIELKKNKNVTELKNVSFSWIRKILEDKITSKAGKASY